MIRRIVTAGVVVLMVVLLLGFAFAPPRGAEQLRLVGILLWLALIAGAVVVVAVAPVRRRVLARSRLLSRLFRPRLSRAERATLTKGEKRVVSAFATQYAEWMLHAGVAREVATPDGRLRTFPALVKLELRHAGPAAEYQTVPSTTPSDWVSEKLSSALGARCVVEPVGAARVRVQLVSREPLGRGRAASFATTVQGAPVLGRFEDGADFALDLVGDPYSVAVQGASRSGKSVAVYGLLGGYAEAAALGEVVVCGVDPTGVLLSPFQGYPGAEFRALGLSDLDAIPTALTALVAEMDRRIATQLMAQGKDKLDRADAPTLLVVLEEYPGLLAALDSADKALKPDARRLPVVKAAVQRLIQEGAKVSTRCLILAQRADASIIGGSERSNLGTRVSLRVADADAVRMLHPDAAPELVERVRGFQPGYALVERAGMAVAIVRFDMADYAAYREHVAAAALMGAGHDQYHGSLRTPFGQLNARGDGDDDEH